MNEFLPAECPLHDRTDGSRDQRLFFRFIGIIAVLPDFQNFDIDKFSECGLTALPSTAKVTSAAVVCACAATDSMRAVIANNSFFIFLI